MKERVEGGSVRESVEGGNVCERESGVEGESVCERATERKQLRERQC